MFKYSHGGPLTVLGLCLALAQPFPARADYEIERAQLAAVLRQLDALERHADSSATLSHSIAARYHFDYLRLREDIQRIRSGVQSYLTPQRAQPRDPAPMLGEYIGEADAP
ncbi:RAQPRD family integrative conjugative element protein [Stenotrophomonas maltophilia]|nr:RAQPRD family integrative conjugative element protein [Stenotrophomonas maltophilia]EMB2829840.1 RAQPRD family integrative conjugative element protein [Stenotrophomonas maltophilia]MBH1450962.1 RAQPRD family integrative conjugative element protein [Stenotrophomonas maltophilia]MBH1566226.1 RAQPRD family integrative conjugative element protein [Stenotrophomonas maltophilia]MBH1727781.1 RAQPRD family integrative conjugative element protein [Stenotrophomonas maltophilia]MBK5593373.1 RAQPRD fam